jgi:hypothetical protein
MKNDDFFKSFSNIELEETRKMLDELHLRKIDLSDEVYILNVNGYIGEGTRNEINYAKSQNKIIRYLERIIKL